MPKTLISGSEMHHILFWRQIYLSVMLHFGCHDYLYFLVTGLVINISTVISKFTLFACSVKMDVSLLNKFPMLSFSVEGTGKTLKEERFLLPSSCIAAW